MVDEVHWDQRICEETLEAIGYSRFNQLVKRGVTPQAARLFAVIERDKRWELARFFGADEALLAKLQWIEMGASGVSMKLILDDAPDDLAKRFVHEIEPLPQDADVDALLS